jgi:hypothetical protein
MESRVKEHISPTQTVADTSEREGTTADRNWLEAELLVCGVPEFGLDQWLQHFMQEAVASDMTDERLLNFFCLARDKALSDDPDFIDILKQTEVRLFTRMPDGVNAPHKHDEETGYEPDEHADAMEALCAGDMRDRSLVELFDLAATMRGEPEFGHVWQAVMYLSRVQILQRMKRVRQHTASSGTTIDDADGEPDDGGDRDNENEPDDTEDFVSLRDALRVAEETFRPDISDAQLLELFVLVEENSNPDEEAFDEIADAVSEMVWDRLREGVPDTEFERHLENFDYPDHGKQALKAVLKGRLPHRNLLMLYRLCWDSTDPTWLAVQDLCRGQILRRMTPPQEREGRHYQRWRQLQLTRRVQLYR